eukprot:CAMPEP_0183706152 /NCGR_PEP_ID=MMETSP0737-20130205/3056_1 /TAXON_ID=385413 /ORGANISM="Thalassiosira miniscula, Strain CCMP1093" /LENGTH=361 /DNA_ID=CAMNT_0025933487 /DNA_START=369 /DNA_END=1454 /DNA_ORIENTATION=+
MSVQDVPQEKETMRVVLATAHGSDIDALLRICDNYPKPRRKTGEVLIQIHACALAPGDIRVLAGHCDYFQEPPNGFPYIPGGDVSGIVVEADEGSRFVPGHEVMAMFELPRPLNGLAEYVSVKEELVEMAPKTIPLVEASTLPSSALAAMTAAEHSIRVGDRVLVLGGGGGVGTFFVQLAKAHGASFVAVTSTTDKGWLLPSLGADLVINYAEKNWWEIDQLLLEDSFDLIVDLGVGRDAWKKAKQAKLLDRHGRFVAITADNPLMELHNLRQALATFGKMQWRILWTKLWPCTPRYIWYGDLLECTPGRLAEVEMFVDNGMRVVLDPVSPLPFTEEGVKRGFRVMKKRHAHGKVVVSMVE